jgi:hypothetical protein
MNMDAIVEKLKEKQKQSKIEINQNLLQGSKKEKIYKLFFSVLLLNYAKKNENKKQKT